MMMKRTMAMALAGLVLATPALAVDEADAVRGLKAVGVSDCTISQTLAIPRDLSTDGMIVQCTDQRSFVVMGEGHRVIGVLRINRSDRTLTEPRSGQLLIDPRTNAPYRLQ